MRSENVSRGRSAAKSAAAAGLALLLLSPVEATLSGAPSKIPYVVRQAVEQASAPPPVEAQIEAVSPGPTVVGPLGGEEIRGVQMDGAGNLLLDLHSAAPITDAEISDIAALGATVVSSTKDMKAPPGYNVIQAWVPGAQLDALEALAWITAVRPVAKIPPDTGTFESEGVTLHSANLVQDAGFDGTGFTIGAISDGVTTLAYAVGTGDLPAGVNVLDAGSGDEGTAMLEIIHDMAPGAGLAFHGTGSGALDHISAQNDLVAANIDILTEDIPFHDEPAFQQGAVAANGDNIAAGGIPVHSSAGNRGDQHAARVLATGTGSAPEGHTGTFTDCTIDPTNVVDIDPGPGNSFDVMISGDFGITLQWSEPRSIFPTAGAGGFTDLDLYLVTVDGSGNTTCQLESLSLQGPAGSGDTIEEIFGTGAGSAKIVVNVANLGAAVAPPTIDLRWYGRIQSLDNPTRDGSLNPDSNYIGLATSAAAADAGDPINGTNPATVALENFSSGGPVDLFLTTVCPGGIYPCPAAAVAGSQVPGTPRNAPDWTGADGVDISGAGGFGSGTCPAALPPAPPGDCEFFGTSASAPHAAACDALVRHAAGTPLTVADVNTRLASTAFDRGAVGPDTSWGAGVLNCAFAAGIADLRFPAKGDSPDPVVAGTDLTYSLAINNAGPAPAVDVTITDTTPVGTTFVSATPSAGGSCTTPAVGGTGLVSCTWSGETPVVPDPNSVRTVTLVVHVPASTPDATVISNTAEVTSSSPDPELINNSASADTTVITQADLSITKSDDPDPVTVFDPLTYTLEVANAGPSDAQSVLVTDTLPLGVTLVATSGCAEDPGGAPTCTLGTIAAGSGAQYTIVVTVDAPLASLTLTNNAEVASATTDPDLTNNTASTDTTADDGDGVDPAVEAQVPGVNGSAQGDGDGNGIQDNLEPWTASVPSMVGDCWFTVTNAELYPLEDVMAEPPHPYPAIGAAFPCGMVSYEVVLPGAGAGVDVQLWMYPPRAGYVGLGKSGPFGTVRLVDTVPNNVDIKAVFGFRGTDGKDLDEDNTADGIFSDPIGPIRGQEFPMDMVHPSRPVPTLLPLGLGLLGLLLAGVAYRARRRR